MASHFCLPEVGPSELAATLRERGLPVSFDESRDFVAVRALIMGFSWAVYLAQIALEDMLMTGVPWATTSNQLAHGRPVPPITTKGPVHWQYIDDYGILVLEKDGAGESGDLGIEGARADVKAALNRNGMPVHKEEVGGTVTTLGWRLETDENGDMFVEPDPRNIELLVKATIEACQRKSIETSQLMTLVSTWTWFALVLHPALSIFQ